MMSIYVCLELEVKKYSWMVFVKILYGLLFANCIFCDLLFYFPFK